MKVINAKGLHFRYLNQMVRDAIVEGDKEILLKNVNGQYYIANGLRGNDIRITVEGVPGNDLCAFMDGPTVIVKANGQDNIGNTMNDGKIIVHGHAGDVLGYAMRGGKLFIKDDVGYRIGIHMKGFMDKIPVIVIGGTARDFLGEYMAGGILILLGLNRSNGQPIAGDYLGTGMHGGVMYIKGDVDPYRCGKEIGIAELDDKDMACLELNLREYCTDLGIDFNKTISGKFIKVYPKTSRPYGRLYAY
jgi:glutamate synthase domain-containing protein 3